MSETFWYVVVPTLAVIAAGQSAMIVGAVLIGVFCRGPGA
jgi:hypothetical protein